VPAGLVFLAFLPERTATMTTPTPPHRHTIGIHRREFLQIGYSGVLGLGLSALPTRAAGQSREGDPRPPRSLILVWLTGAPSQLDTFDLKPEAPPEIRGEFKPIATNVAGIQVGEHLPRLAARADKYAIVRSLSHRENNHLVATHHLLTGHQQPGAFFDKVLSRDDWPCFAAGLHYLRPASDGIPTGVHLPVFLSEGPLTWPGQHGGFLGPRHDPLQVKSDPNKSDFAVDNLRLAPGLEIDRLGERRTLLDQVNRQQRWLDEQAEGRRLSEQQQRALSVLTSGRIARAFEMDREPAAIRDRYGRHAFGQSLLLARRLVQAGVPVVQANMGRAQTWDSHGNIFPRLKKELLPPLDQGVAALLDDLHTTGLLAETLVVLLGEFGRTPKISGTPPGRDHWAACFSGLFAGAGVRGGQVIGRSDKVAAYPATMPYSPDDVGATVYHVLGVDPASEVRDRQDRPVQLNRGTVMQSLFTGAAG
jgi:hypothetical protein